MVPRLLAYSAYLAHQFNVAVTTDFDAPCRGFKTKKGLPWKIGMVRAVYAKWRDKFH